MILNKRLATIEQLCDSSCVTADIGCDHGKLGFALLESNKVKRLIATDISAPSLNKAEKLLSGRFDGKYDCRVGDGLKALRIDDQVDQIVVAGMGGKEIEKMFEVNTDLLQSAKVLVLQPMRGVVCVRRWLNKNGFKIVRDLVVKDKRKYYHVIKAKPGKRDLSEQQILFGADKDAWQEPDYQAWLVVLEHKELQKANEVEKAPERAREQLLKEINKNLEYINMLKIKE